MTIYDAAMAAVLILGMARGAWRGITWQLASIGSLGLGYLFAFPISAQIAPLLPGPPESTRAMAMAAAYVLVSGGVFAAAWTVRNTIRRYKFEAYDRHLGMMLGGVEGVGVAILLTLLTVSVAPNTRGPIFASPSGRVMSGVVGVIGPILPGEVRQSLAPYWSGRASEARIVANDPDEAVAESEPELQASAAELDPLSAPSAESPVVDGAVQPAAAQAPPAAQATPKPVARSFFDAVVDSGKQEAERFVAETLDSDPDQKAATLRELVDKDKARLKSAVSDVVGETAQSLSNQVSEAVDATRQDLSNQVSEAVDATRQNVSKQIQDQAGRAQKQIQNQAGRVQGQVNRAQGQINQAQGRLNQGRRQLEQGLEGAINRGQQQVERSVEGAINQQLRRLGVPQPVPAPAPTPAKAPQP